MAEKTKFREIVLSSDTKILLGKDAKGNDELMRKFKGRENTILHTVAPGSPFCVVNILNPTKDEIYSAGIFVSKYSQDWRDNKKDVAVSIFTGKNISKPKDSKTGTWNVKKSRTIKIRKEDIEKIKKKKLEPLAFIAACA